MQDAPKGERRHIALVGRRNAGKSRLLNTIAGQQVSIVSSTPGTTTDPVEKAMELGKLGPVVLIDTAGLDDEGQLGAQRNKRSLDILRRADLALIITEGDAWGNVEAQIMQELGGTPYLIARNKSELGLSDSRQWRRANKIGAHVPIVDVSAKQALGIEDLLAVLTVLAGEEERKPIAADLLPEHGLALLVVPIDSGAPKGRLILPQAQTIRDCLDQQKLCLITTDKQLPAALERLRPDLVICDSQVARQAAEATPEDIPFTTFSILMARYKGNLEKFAAGAETLKTLRSGDTVLIQEACSHHAQKDDIGAVKIPRLLCQMAGGDLNIRHSQGKELIAYPNDLKAIIHCGACVITAKQMRVRQENAEKCQIPMTNYGMAITLAQGLLERALKPFQQAGGGQLI